MVDNLLTGKQANLQEVRDDVEFHELDIRDGAALEKVFTGIDVVFHEAAIPSVPRSIAEPELSHDVNVNGTFNVFLAAHRQGLKRVVYAASSSTYGDTPTLPKTESMLPNPKSPYAVQKLLGEYYGKTFWEVFGLETVSLRYFMSSGRVKIPARLTRGSCRSFVKRFSRAGRPRSSATANNRETSPTSTTWCVQSAGRQVGKCRGKGLQRRHRRALHPQ